MTEPLDSSAILGRLAVWSVPDLRAESPRAARLRGTHFEYIRCWTLHLRHFVRIFGGAGSRGLDDWLCRLTVARFRARSQRKIPHLKGGLLETCVPWAALLDRTTPGGMSQTPEASICRAGVSTEASCTKSGLLGSFGFEITKEVRH